MNEPDLDQTYTALCEALAGVGQAQAPLFLSIVCLSLISRMDNAQPVLALIASASAACQDGAAQDQSAAASSG